MEFSCQRSGCSNKAERSCVCDPRVMLCCPDFIDFHLTLPGKHAGINISDQIANFCSKVQEAYQNLEKAKNLIISTGDLMINKIGSIIKTNLSKLITKKTEIAQVSKPKNSLQENFEFLEKVMKFEVVDEPLDNFEEIVKNYIRFDSNFNELALEAKCSQNAD